MGALSSLHLLLETRSIRATLPRDGSLGPIPSPGLAGTFPPQVVSTQIGTWEHLVQLPSTSVIFPGFPDSLQHYQ